MDQRELDEQLTFIARANDELYRRYEGEKFYRMYPKEGELAIDKYPKHIKFFGLGHEKPFRLFLGGNGVGKCSTISSVIPTVDGDKTVGDLYEAGLPFYVWAWNGEKPVKALASAPFQKPGLHHCFRLTMADGQWFECADDHRLLCDDGWKRLSELLPESASGHPQSISGHVLSVRAADDRSSSKTLQDFRECYSLDRRLDDGRLQTVQGSASISSPSPVDVLQRTLPECKMDAPANKHTSIRQSIADLRSRIGVYLRDVTRAVGSSIQTALSIAGSWFRQYQDVCISGHGLVSHPPGECELDLKAGQTFSSCHPSACSSPLVVGGNRIVSVDYIGVHKVYDFTVAWHHNYIAANLIHHNTEGIGCFEVTCHLTGIYPDWWPGIRYTKPVYAVIAGNTNENVRDIIQPKLIGRKGMYGTGMVPRDKLPLDRVLLRSGSSGAVDNFAVQHVSGGFSHGQFKSYEMGSEAFMGFEADVIWLDEEPPPDIYSECVQRFRTRQPCMLITFTPLDGISEVVSMFLPEYAQDYNEAEYEASGRAYIMCGQDEVPHLTDLEKERLIANSLAYQREARRLGIPSIGAGKIYPYEESSFVIAPIPGGIPRHWPRIYGMDVGINTTAALFMAVDRDADIVYGYSEHYMHNTLPPVHAQAIKARGVWIPGEIDPSSRNRSANDGEKLFEIYSSKTKGLGLKLRKANNAVEAGIFAVQERIETGRFKLFNTCTNFISEFRLYRRDKRGKIVKQRDHLMDCGRYGLMGLEHAETPHAEHANRAPKLRETTFGLYGPE